MIHKLHKRGLRLTVLFSQTFRQLIKHLLGSLVTKYYSTLIDYLLAIKFLQLDKKILESTMQHDDIFLLSYWKTAKFNLISNVIS